MAGYVYGGTTFDAVTKKGPKASTRPFDPALCGTIPGISQHRRFEQTTCLECRELYNERRRQARAEKAGDGRGGTVQQMTRNQIELVVQGQIKTARQLLPTTVIPGLTTST